MHPWQTHSCLAHHKSPPLAYRYPLGLLGDVPFPIANVPSHCVEYQ
ncbi:Uncharacterised protein [Vibrio cholerae]|nr:Uncharacterised protein [Vibrio cholerae]